LYRTVAATYINNFYHRSPGFIDLLNVDGVYDYYMDGILAAVP